MEVAVEKVVTWGAEKEFGESREIVFKGLFVEKDSGEAEKIIFEIVQVPGDGLTVETGVGIADGVVEVAAGFDLEARQDGDNFAIGFDHLWRDIFPGAILGEEFEERGVAKVFFEIGPVVEIFGVNFRNGKVVVAKMFGECEEGGIFFADTVENSNGADFCVSEPDDFTAGAAKFALSRDAALGRAFEVLLAEFLA